MELQDCALKKSTFTLNEIKTLFLLKEKNGLTRQEIIKLHQITEPGIYKLIEKLNNFGIIKKIENPERKNNETIKITELGLKCLQCHMRWIEESSYIYPGSCVIARW